MSNEDYRNTLDRLAEESQRSFDKTLLTLTSGALVLSVTYTTSSNAIYFGPLLVFAWVAWCLSLSIMLFSFLASAHALRKGRSELDGGKEEPPAASGAS